MKTILIALLLLTNSYYSFAQQDSAKHIAMPIADSVLQLINEIAKQNIFEYKTIGIAGSISEQYQRYEKLVSLASVEDLLYISKNNANAVVRLYAFTAIKEKGFAVPQDIQDQFNNDRAKLQTLDGCYGRITSVALLSKNLSGMLSSTSQRKKDTK